MARNNGSGHGCCGTIVIGFIVLVIIGAIAGSCGNSSDDNSSSSSSSSRVTQSTTTWSNNGSSGTSSSGNTSSSSSDKVSNYEKSVRQILHDDFSVDDNCNIEVTGTQATIELWVPGLAQIGASALEGDKDFNSLWNSWMADFSDLSSELYDNYKTDVSSSGHVQLNVLSDQDTSTTIMSFKDGEPVYDEVSAGGN